MRRCVCLGVWEGVHNFVVMCMCVLCTCKSFSDRLEPNPEYECFVTRLKHSHRLKLKPKTLMPEPETLNPRLDLDPPRTICSTCRNDIM